MSRPRFLADHNLNEQIVVGVLRLVPSAEFRPVRELGFATRDDAFLLDYAARQGLIIVSHDVNTMPAAAYIGGTCTKVHKVSQPRPIDRERDHRR